MSMKPGQRAIFLASLLLASLAGFYFFYAEKHDPSYQGKRLSVWLHDMDGHTEAGESADESNARTRRAEIAIRALSSRAVPSLVAMLRARDSRLKMKLMELGDKYEFVQKLLDKLNIKPVGDNIWLLFGILREVGDKGKKLAPELVKMLVQDSDLSPASESIAMSLLSEIGEETTPPLVEMLVSQKIFLRKRAVKALGYPGHAETLAVPALLKAFRNDADMEIRTGAARALGIFASKNEEVLSALRAGLDDAQIEIRVACLQGNGQYLPIARSVVPDVLRCLKSPEVEIQIAALEVLRTIGGWDNSRSGRTATNREVNLQQDREVILPALIENLQSTNTFLRARSAIVIASFKREASMAIPALEKLTKDETPSGFGSVYGYSVSESAKRALGEIKRALAQTNEAPRFVEPTLRY